VVIELEKEYFKYCSEQTNDSLLEKEEEEEQG